MHLTPDSGELPELGARRFRDCRAETRPEMRPHPSIHHQAPATYESKTETDNYHGTMVACRIRAPYAHPCIHAQAPRHYETVIRMIARIV